MAVAETKRSSPLDIGLRFSVGHPLSWLAITVLLLLTGYAWLSVYAGNGAESDNFAVVKKIIPDSSVQEQEQIVASLVKQEKMTIAREGDENRAKSYLEFEAVEQQILPLLDAADVHFEVGQYVNPPGDNAWEDYQSILAINPNESVATAGLTKIKSRLITGAEQAIDQGDFAEAENWLVQLDKIQPGDVTQSDLRTELSQQIKLEAERKLRQQEAETLQGKVATSLSQAEQEETKIPINYNKLKDLYDRVSQLDPTNAEAREGLIRLSDQKLDEVEQWLHGDNIEQAQIGLNQAFSIFPANKRISSLNLALNSSIKQKQQLEQQKLLEQQQLEQQKLEQEARDQAKQKRDQELAETKRQKQQKQKSANAAKKTAATSPLALLKPIASAETGSVTVTQKAPENPVTPSKIETQAATPTTLSFSNTELGAIAARKEVLQQGVKAYYSGDYNRSFELLYPLAQEDVPRAQFRIGIMYQFGRSVSVNKDLAEKWFTAALPDLLREAQQGVAWAQTDLGTAYEFGISLQQDYERAAYWYQQAADNGYAGAQTNLGVLYAQGDGVNYDRAKAVFWLRKAAAQGDRVALENLGIMGESP